MARPGTLGIRGRRVAILIADRVEGAATVYAALAEAGAVPRYVGAKLGIVRQGDDERLAVDVTMEAAPAVLFDALVLPDAADALANDGQAAEFIKDQYRHCKPILALGSAEALLEGAGAFPKLPSGEPDDACTVAPLKEVDRAIRQFIAALERHRNYDRETERPAV